MHTFLSHQEAPVKKSPQNRLGERLREARLDAMMTLGQVEMETGIRTNQLCRLERHGKKIAFETVARLARVYRVSLDELAEVN
jgi:transcriptional regulator with XRE-family HTH domain